MLFFSFSAYQYFVLCVAQTIETERCPTLFYLLYQRISYITEKRRKREQAAQVLLVAATQLTIVLQ